MFAHACKLGLEGIVSKRAGSRYWSGSQRAMAEVEESGFSAGECASWKRTDLGAQDRRPSGASLDRALTGGRCPRERPLESGGGSKAGGAPMKISARNQLQGTIVEVVKGATTAHVQIEVGGSYA